MPAHHPYTRSQAAERLGKALQTNLDSFSESETAFLLQLQEVLADEKKIINVKTIETVLIKPLTVLFKRFWGQEMDSAKMIYKAAYEVLITLARQFPRNDFNKGGALLDPVDLSEITDEEIERGEIFFTTDRFAFRISNFIAWCERGKINPLTQENLSAWDESLFEVIAKRSKQAPARKGEAAEVKADEDSIEALLPGIQDFIHHVCTKGHIKAQERDAILNQMKKKTGEEQRNAALLIDAFLEKKPTLLPLVNRVLPFRLEAHQKMLTFIEKYGHLFNEDILNSLVSIAKENRLHALLRADLSCVEQKSDHDEMLPSERLLFLMQPYTDILRVEEPGDPHNDEELLFLKEKIKQSLKLLEKYRNHLISLRPFFAPENKLRIIDEWRVMLTNSLNNQQANNLRFRCALLTSALEKLQADINAPDKGGVLSMARHPHWDRLFGKTRHGESLCDELTENIAEALKRTKEDSNDSFKKRCY